MNAARKLGLIAAAAAMALTVAAPVAQAAGPTVAERNLASPITFDTCYPPNANGSWSKNKVGTCTKTRLSYKHYACPETSCAVDATATAWVTTINNLLPGSRQV